MKKWVAAVFLTALAVTSNATPRDGQSELRLEFGVDGRRETIKLAAPISVDQRTPRKKAPFKMAAWRVESGTPRTPAFSSTLVQLSLSDVDSGDVGLGLLFERNGEFRNYGVACRKENRVPCDPAKQGMTHDPANKRVRLEKVLLERVTLKDVGPEDTITVSGTLSYAQ